MADLAAGHLSAALAVPVVAGRVGEWAADLPSAPRAEEWVVDLRATGQAGVGDHAGVQETGEEGRMPWRSETRAEIRTGTCSALTSA